jgi:hypothetical protein
MKKSINNIVYGITGQLITILIGLLLPRLRIVSFGSEINGMLSSIQQIYSYLALLEAGVGTATLQALYGPVAKDNKKSINEILAATNKFYKKTGCIYLLSILVFAIVYPFAVNTNISAEILVKVILLNGLGNVLAYFFQGKYKILLQAEGKQYVITNLTTFVTVFSGITKIVLIKMGCGVVSLQVAYFLFNVIQVCFFAFYIRKHYRWINLKVNPDEKAISQKNAALVHQISQMIFNNTDVLILTVFCGLKIVSVYALYNMVYDMVSTLISNINNGFSFKLGQLFNSDMKSFFSLYNLYERYYTAMSFAFYCVAYLLITPFIKLYTRGVTDIDYLIPYIPILFTAIKLMVSGRAPSGFVASYAGHFKKTQNRAIIEAIINLLVSLTGVYYWGIYGVLLGTVAALLYRANDMIIYSNVVILKRSPWYTYKWWVIDLVLFAGIVEVFRHIDLGIESYFKFFSSAIFISIIVVIIFMGITYLCSFQETMSFFQSFINRKREKGR